MHRDTARSNVASAAARGSQPTRLELPVLDQCHGVLRTGVVRSDPRLPTVRRAVLVGLNEERDSRQIEQLC